ncbi:MAG: MBL fold metallo-hydrolase [Bdellovibrionaceae bacterium]|nr:MBL fold metallo-hydrolase [Pseudobdellovibrionaceae bacterium]
MHLWSVEGNRQWLDGGAMFGNAPRALWQNWCPPDERGRIELACRGLLARIGDLWVLCETGIGAFMDPKLSDRFGVEPRDRNVLLDSLKAAGINQEQIDIVILSHLHFDHAGGLLPSFEASQKSGAADLLFPNARYVVGAQALERALNPHVRDRASFVPGLAEKLQSSGRLLVIEKTEDARLPKEIFFFFSSGHTPGQMHCCIRGANSTVVFCGDLVPGAAWVPLPITMGYDRFPERLIEEKLQLYEEAVPNRWLLYFTHDPATVASNVELDSKGRYAAVDLKPALIDWKL